MANIERWDSGSADFELDSTIRETTEELNKYELEDLLAEIPPVHTSDKGQEFTIFQSQGSSQEEVIVTFAPFAWHIGPNMQVQGKFVYEALRKNDIHDDKGDSLPLVLFASPAHSSGLLLSKEERQKISNGGLGVYAKEQLDIVRQSEYGRIALLGYSQAADVAASASAEAYGMHLDVRGLAAADPAGVIDRSLPGLVGDFLKEVPRLEKAKRSSDFRLIEEVFGASETRLDAINNFVRANSMYIKGICQQLKSNLALAQGLSEPNFFRNFNYSMHNNNVPHVVAWGENSLITPAATMHENYQNLPGEVYDNLRTIEIAGAHHAWGNQMELLTQVYLQAFEE